MTLIPGDGVGPEIMDSTQEVLLQMGAKVYLLIDSICHLMLSAVTLNS